MAVRAGDRKELDCAVCGNLVEGLLLDVKSVTCSRCVAKMVPSTDTVPKSNLPDEKRPRGWHKKPEYISPSGRKYHYGKEV